MLIFDLDGTVIDSSHRKNTREDGTLDLNHWVENSTPDKIALDKLLPLSEYMRAVYPKEPTIICTARVMGSADYDYLHNNGLYADAILSRPDGNRMPDGILKEFLLRDFATRRGQSWDSFANGAVMFDDCENVIDTLSSVGLTVYNATFINEELI